MRDALWLTPTPDGRARGKVRGRYLIDRAILAGQSQLVPRLLELGAYLTERGLGLMLEQPSYLAKWVGMDQEDLHDYCFEGEVACSWSDYYHDIGKCEEVRPWRRLPRSLLPLASCPLLLLLLL